MQCMCILDLGSYSLDLTSLGDLFSFAEDNFYVFVVTDNKHRFMQQPVYEFIKNHKNVSNTYFVEPKVNYRKNIADKFIYKATLHNHCENFRYIYETRLGLQFDYYYSVTTTTSLDRINFKKLTDTIIDRQSIFFVHSPDKVNDDFYISPYDFFATNSKTVFSLMQTIIYYIFTGVSKKIKNFGVDNLYTLLHSKAHIYGPTLCYNPRVNKEDFDKYHCLEIVHKYLTYHIISPIYTND